MKPAKPVRRWALVEDGKILTGLIFESRMVLLGYDIAEAGRRIARVEIREVRPKRGKRT